MPGLAPAWLPDPMPPYFLYAGSFSENKNQRLLLEAWARLQARHPGLPWLILTGGCPEDYRQLVIRPRLEALPRPAEVLLPGFVTDLELGWLYHHAAGYVQPSLAEGFGLPLLEAMSHGVPVLSSDSTSLPETGADAALYFKANDRDSLEAGIERLWRDEALRRTLVARGADRCRAFTWGRAARSVADAVREELAR